MSITQENGDILEIQFLDFMPVSQVQQQLNAQLGPFAPDAVYNVSVYKIIYQTEDPFGQPAIASGSIAFPEDASRAFPIVSYQHGTQVLRDDVSSNYGFDTINMWLGATGYIVAYPDFLGFGESDMLHPYIIAEPTAESVIHFIMACKTFCDVHNEIQYNSQLYLTGYSEGGFATMAVQKKLEAEFADELPVTVSTPMAGPYDLSGTMFEYLLSGIPYSQPYYAAYILLAYIEYYELGELSDFFTEYYTGLLPSLFDGYHPSWQINQYLPSVPFDILLPEVLYELENDPEHPLRIALSENDLYDWTPVTPTYLIHGLGDELVPYENSQIAYDTFVSNGANDVHLQLYPEALGGHASVSIYCLLGGMEILNDSQIINSLGDVNEDTDLDVLDIVGIVNIILLNPTPPSYQQWAADFNQDGIIDILDIVPFVTYILTY